MLRWVIIASVVAGCGVREDRWDDKVARVSCRTLRRCDPISYWRDYASLDTCVAATDPGDTNFCTYDPRAARECLQAMRWSCRRIGRRYDELVDRCDAVWACAATDDPTTSDTGASSGG